MLYYLVQMPCKTGRLVNTKNSNGLPMRLKISNPSWLLFFEAIAFFLFAQLGIIWFSMLTV